MNAKTESREQHLAVGEGRIAFDVTGSGHLVVLSPGMGDLRSSFRALAPELAAAGCRVASVDLRGHGASDATFASYGDRETSGDLVALIESLGGPAVVVGNSMSAAAAVLVGAERPDLVSGLVLIGPFVRDHESSPGSRLALRVALARPWAVASWGAYLPKLFAGRRPADFEDYRRSVTAAMRLPGHTAAFLATLRTTHEAAREHLGEVSAPSLVIMGELDPDFADPRREADWIAEQIHATVLMVPEAGHYPHAQRPDLVSKAILAFLAEHGYGA